MADERPPIALTLGSGLQSALVVVAPVVVTVAIEARIAGQRDAYIAFAASWHSSRLKSVHGERSISHNWAVAEHEHGGLECGQA